MSYAVRGVGFEGWPKWIGLHRKNSSVVRSAVALSTGLILVRAAKLANDASGNCISSAITWTSSKNRLSNDFRTSAQIDWVDVRQRNLSRTQAVVLAYRRRYTTGGNIHSPTDPFSMSQRPQSSSRITASWAQAANHDLATNEFIRGSDPLCQRPASAIRHYGSSETEPSSICADRHLLEQTPDGNLITENQMIPITTCVSHAALSCCGGQLIISTTNAPPSTIQEPAQKPTGCSMTTPNITTTPSSAAPSLEPIIIRL